MCETPREPHFNHHPYRDGCIPPVHLGMAFGKEVLHEVMKSFSGCGMATTPYDLAETDEEYLLTIPLPGYEAKDVAVSVKGNHVLIEAERKETTPKEGPADAKKLHPIVSMGEYTWNRPRIEAKIPVKDEIDTENVKARLDRGILTVRFKKKPAAKISVAE